MEANLKWLTDPTVFRVNRLDAHSDHVCYASREEAEKGTSSLRQSLDGQWRFFWSKAPALRPADFWKEGYDLSNFGTITVPGHMELQGYGQIQYINKLYPWDGHTFLRPPEIDWDYDPVGSYVREFDLAPGLAGKPVCISFEGVEQAAYVYLNGSFVGYCEDSFTPSDFDLTPFIREKGNRLCVEVYKHSSAAWLEDQDFFRFSGIFRSVFLYAKGNHHLQDMWIKTALLEDNTTGTVTFRLKTEGKGTIRASISHPVQGVLLDEELMPEEQDGYLVCREMTFPDILLWDHGTPEMYAVTLTLYDEKGKLSEVVPYKVGFRRMEIREGIMLLNGKRLYINGVNRHEWNPNSGRVIGIADMEQAMETFRKNNINAVRTCHYPDRTEWYHMCDEEGIYMMDEANLETHGSWQKDMTVDPEWNVPGSLPEWKDCVVDRARSMFERDKNHVSILFWSCGNESYAGEDILAMAEFFRRKDPSRVVHYEGVFHCREFDEISDVESRMYATPGEIREYLEHGSGKPYLNCEYMHNMGNSLGGMESYVTLGEEFPQYQGGFIWDYMDQALWKTNDQGQRVLGYGGDFGERQTDYNFSGNGIVTADGQEKPCMQEARYWHMTPEGRAEHDERNLRAMDEARMEPHPVSEVPLKVTKGDGALGVKGEGFEILFSYGQGGPVSLRWGGTEWLWRAPRPAFWRAPTENDMGCGFAWRSSIWSSVDQWQFPTGMDVKEAGEDRVTVSYHFTAPAMPGLDTEVIYSVDPSGNLDVTVHYHGAPGRPQLPLLGLRFSTPENVQETTWLGLSGETYPDRKKGGVFGLHHEVPGVANYLVPQECGNHMDTHYARFSLARGQLYVEKREDPFHFSAIPYTPWQLEQAFHREELPAKTRTVITVCGKMRGVGGIDTWMTDVEPQYHVSAEEDISFSFRIRGE